MSLSIIHFSDIHINNKEDIIISRVDKLKAACASALPSNGNVVIAISGDIAYSGEKGQYDLAKDLLNAIVEHIRKEKNSKVSVVCVPGNHDCNFSDESSVRKTLIESPKPEDVDITYYNTVNEVQSEYVNFSRTYNFDANQVLPQKEIVVGDGKVLFLLANTAWMSTLKEKPGKTIIPHSLFGDVKTAEYKAVFYMFHHPVNWLNPSYKNGFVDHVRQNADIVLVGHEHARDSYEKTGESFSIYCNHGKELQDCYSDNSAFTVLNFDNAFQTYDVIDFSWNGTIYNRQAVKTNQFHKNVALCQTVFHPNTIAINYANDMGIAVNHFAKDNVTLQDLFIWPDINRCNYHNEKGGVTQIRSDIIEELSRNSLNILVGSSSSGKTALAKKLFLLEEPRDICCLLISGSLFKSSDESKIRGVIEECFARQYAAQFVEEFYQLEKSKRIIIVDDFDLIKLNKNRRNLVLDFLCDFFGKVTLFISSSMELPTILTSKNVGALEQLIYYEILPLGNKKRNELISKWYRLDEENLSEDEIDKRVDIARNQIDTFLGNGAAFIPALPVFIISALQNGDAIKQSFSGSKYGFLYESLIISSLSKISADYTSTGAYNIDINVLSKLAFGMLKCKTTSFTEGRLRDIVEELSEEFFLHISANDFLRRMQEANIIYLDSSGGEIYRFKYPYIFYYFAGRYIAYHMDENSVQDMLECMSSKLHNETYGNIIIFVCHFANSIEVIDDVLLNAYGTLDGYEAFDFTKINPIFEDIREAVDALVPASISKNEEVSQNKDKALMRMDAAGINDGQVNKGEEIIDDEVNEKEKDMAAVISALKTIEVLGQILQNYPVEIKGNEKVDIINEMHKLGMRSVQAIIKTMGYLEKDLVEFVYEKAANQKKNIRREDVMQATHRFITMIISGMARGMVHQVALSLNSEYLLPAAHKTFSADDSISSKLVYLDLKLTCLRKVDYIEISNLRKTFEANNEKFAVRILDSIIGHYLNYNQCDYSLRAKLCELCGFSQQRMLTAPSRNALN